ncbi:TPA: type-F conjugative transfer system pilin assembly thiol-disulfide isomerase TrbB [Escherichia coli]|nr:type-F conjugative transfer system pilin assembly thiol-disulfide isomerase TrbB [Escherichia coli]
MASINTIVKRKQYLWLGIVVVGTASAIGGALYLSDVDMSGNGETVAEQEPVPDMTGVVDTTFDDKVRQHATTEMQVTAAQMQKQYEEIRRELDVLNKQRGDDQRRIEKLGQDNAALAEQVKALGANPVTATGEPVPQMPASPPGPEGEPQPGNTPVAKPAPRWFRLSNGRQVNLADWKVVLFMQGHCPYCHQFDPVLKQLAQQYGFSVFSYTLDGQGDTAFPEALPVPPEVMQTFFPNIPVATPTTFLVNVNTLEALPLLQGATDAAGFMARVDTVLQMYGGKKGAK